MTENRKVADVGKLAALVIDVAGKEKVEAYLDKVDAEKRPVKMIPLYQALARDVVWLSQVNDTYRDQAGDRLAYHCDFLPSGAGIDCGTTTDIEASRDNRLVLHLSYHHMNDVGFYDGWTEHTVKVTPSLANGFNLSISGRDRNDIKDYLVELYDSVLSELVPEYTPAELGKR